MAVIRLDSVNRADAWNLPPTVPSRILRCDGRDGPAVLTADGRVDRTWADPLDALRWMQTSFVEPAARWAGYLSYDCGRWFESFDRSAVDDLRTPWFVFGDCPRSTGVPPVPGGARQGRNARATKSRITSNFDPAGYRRLVARALDYIRAGDIFQVNLSQRFDVTTAESAVSVYDRLIARSPSRYAALLDFDSSAIVSHSPELFLRVTPDRRVVTRPIKGTRARGPGMETSLRDSIKDAAELNMIVDLERNDLGRVCELGSVRVTRRREVETLPTVYHGVAEIEGRLRPGVDFVDLLRATFPGGSVTGAPKVRAMQIIDELEPVRRGAYCGAIGYLAADGSMQFNVAIRTMTFQNGHVYVSVGGGIVADSNPAEEYEETMVKAAAMFDALGVSLF